MKSYVDAGMLDTVRMFLNQAISRLGQPCPQRRQSMDMAICADPVNIHMHGVARSDIDCEFQRQHTHSGIPELRIALLK